MVDVLKTVNPRRAAQIPKGVGVKVKEEMKRSAGGGFTFVVDDFSRLRRFLILGSDGSFYRSGAKMTKDNAKFLVDFFSQEIDRPDAAGIGVYREIDERNLAAVQPLIDEIVAVSVAGRAPKNNPALFALAIASTHGSTVARQYARSKVNEVARTSTHLYDFVTYYLQFAGWGRGLRGVVASWYSTKTVDQNAYQMVKYQEREGQSHKRLLATSHVQHPDPAFHDLARWVRRGDKGDGLPKLVKGFLKAHKAGADLPKLIAKYRLSWEMLPTQALNDKKVWKALLDTKGAVPYGALVRQLSRLTRNEVIRPAGNGATREIVKRLTDRDELKKARQHPLNLLIAKRTYDSGRGERNTWTPVREISEALEEAFHLSFDLIEPTGLRYFQALDISPSMTNARLGTLPISASEAAAALVLVTLKTEPFTFVGGFASSFVPLPSITKHTSLRGVTAEGAKYHFGGTDIGASIKYAIDHKIEVDVFIIYTDNEPNRGAHPHQMLEEYRRKMKINAKLIVIGMTATKSTIGNTDDPGTLDVVGFDTAMPSLIAEFAKG